MDILKYSGLYLLLTIVMLTSACATYQPMIGGPESAAWESHRRTLDDLNDWEMKGRLAVRLDNKAWSATIHWEQNYSAYELLIIAPLGQGTYEINGDKTGVRLRTSENEVFESGNAEALLRKKLGWGIPLKGLIYWVRGLPEPGMETDRILFDKEGRVISMAQSGWQIAYAKYADHGNYVLPGKVTLENEQLKVRLVIKEWNINI